jgi:hypothetical protein
VQALHRFGSAEQLRRLDRCAESPLAGIDQANSIELPTPGSDDEYTNFGGS